MSLSVLMLSGAGLPRWIWDDVGAPGAVVAQYPTGRASLADYADAVAAQAATERFVVVAHSIGGAIAAEVRARHGHRVAGVLGLCAVVPPPRASFVSVQPFPARTLLPVLLRIAGTRPPEAAIRKGLAQRIPESTTGRLLTDLVPESRRLFLDRVAASSAPAVPAGYLRTTSDTEVELAQQTRSARELGATWIDDIPCGHLPQIERPDLVTQALERLMHETVPH